MKYKKVFIVLCQVFSFFAVLSFIGAVTLPYYSFDDVALITDPKNVGYNLPSFLLLLTGLVMTFTRFRNVSFPMFLIAIGFVGIGSISWLGRMFNGYTPGPGALLDIGIVAFSLFAAISLIISGEVKLKFSATTAIWAGIALVLYLMYWIGNFMPWTRTTSRLNSDWEWTETGTSTLVEDCCVPFVEQSTISNFRNSFELLFGLLFIVVILLMKEKRVSAAAFCAFGLYLFSLPLDWLVGIRNSEIDPLTEGYSAGEIAEQGIRITQSPLIGGWISSAAALLMILMSGILFLIHRAISDDDVNAESHCGNCGFRILTVSQFCPSCGAPTAVLASSR